MKIDAAQRSVLEEVREMMQMDAESDNKILSVSHYICSNILYVLLARDGLGEDVSEKYLSEDSTAILDSLREAISRGMGRRITFGSYMRRALYAFDFYADAKYEQFVVLGRLAWLDKILETGEIVAMEDLRSVF